MKFLAILMTILGTSSLRAESLQDLLKMRQQELGVVSYVESARDYGLMIYPKRYFSEDLGTGKYADHLENDFFKVVEGTHEEALPLSDLDGRNVFYHMNLARDYFKNIEPNNQALWNKAVIRVRVKSTYNVIQHFGQAEYYNDSQFIGRNYKGLWNAEAWFHSPQDTVEWAKLLGATAGAVVKPPLLIALPFILKSAMHQGLDSAKIPAVIYHEAFHWASNDEEGFPANAFGNWLSEDYANYFAVSLLGIPRMTVPGFGDTHRDFSRIRPVTRRLLWISRKDNYNYIGFLTSIFWQVRQILGQKRADAMIWASMKRLPKRPSHLAVVSALLGALGENREISAAERSQVDSLFEKHMLTLQRLDEFWSRARAR